MSAIPAELLDTVTTGDARELARLLPDGSVDLCFCDPVYEQISDYAWVAEECARVLKPTGALLVWQGVKWMPETLIALSGHGLTYRWTFGLSHLNACVGTIKGHVYSHWTPLFWFAREEHRPSRRVRDFCDVPILSGASQNHAWHKSDRALSYWLDACSPAPSVVWDPFTGGGTVPAVCKQLGRRYVAFEIDATTAENARQRIRNTPLPLFLPDPPAPPLTLALEVTP